MNPPRQSGLVTRFTTMAFTSSSSTSPPLARIDLAARPSTVSLRHSARSMSPVEIAGIFLRSEMNLDWVPFPDPGAPKSRTIKHPPKLRAFEPPIPMGRPGDTPVLPRKVGHVQAIESEHRGQAGGIPGA